MKLREITDALERAAPLALQEAYDNAGLITGDPDMEITGALLCLDATEAVLDDAATRGANLGVSHHPIVFRPLRSITGRSNVDRVVIRAIRNDIALYAAHTNLDRAVHGMSHALARKLGLRNIEVLDPEAGGTGFGAIGELAEPVATVDFLRTVRSALNIGCIRHSALCRDTVRRVALIAGSGGDGLEKAIEAGADLFLTADLRYDRFLAAEKRIVLADIGHFESEIVAISLLYEILTKNFPTFALHKSNCSHNPVNYLSRDTI
jgi:dinuclear metal center YbgI/SA1388 family protein